LEIAIIILVILELFLLIIIYLIFNNGRKIRKEIKKLEGGIDDSRKEVFKYKDISSLPQPVKLYFRHVIQDGQEYINEAKISQSGLIRLKEGQKWMPFKAVQYFNGRMPAFIWIANSRSSTFVWFSARDKYYSNRANMMVKLFSLFTIVDSSGEEMDISSLIRYFSELPWLPTSLLPSNYLSWKPLDNSSAKAVLNDGRLKAAINFYFSGNGELNKVIAPKRFRFVDGRLKEECWTGYFKNYRKINNIIIPTEVEAEWSSGSKNFKYIKIKLENIEYD